jgi:chorismate mutase
MTASRKVEAAGGSAPAADSASKPQPSLADLRREIDRIDETMHRLLMERGEIIATLIAVKKSDETGSAFRPGREAEMMRRLAARHSGLLPLDTAEGIWRVIIGTFTYVQKAYSVHADISRGDAPMRDSARFHFGFTVPFVPHMGAASVVAAVSESKGDLGLVPAVGGAGSGAWWSALEFDSAPKIIARLPFLDRADHPAALPVFVISRAAPDAMVTEVAVWSVRVSGWSVIASRALSHLAEFIAVPRRWCRLERHCVPPPSSGATRPAIRSLWPARGRSRPAREGLRPGSFVQDPFDQDLFDVFRAASAAAPRRA